jgi:hypothetical protein
MDGLRQPCREDDILTETAPRNARGHKTNEERALLTGPKGRFGRLQRQCDRAFIVHGGVATTAAIHSRTSLATNSGPLSDRM